ncbi:retrotransposon unclassified [Hordeum vulgare]|nr:retrotransposon unclassified [Hordeum vulgare]
MLFTIAIDVLKSMLIRVVELGLLQLLTTWNAASNISLYANDMVIFYHPDKHDIFTVRELLHVFGVASGLRTNFNKCSATPLQSTDDYTTTIASEMQCPVKQLPIQYLGLPLSIRKPSTSSLIPGYPKAQAETFHLARLLSLQR